MVQRVLSAGRVVSTGGGPAAALGGWTAVWQAARPGGRERALTETGDAILASLMVQAQQGDQDAYRALLRSVVPFAAAVARRQGVATDAVDDVVQEVLLTLHRARATYDPRRPFLPWLRAIAQRRAVDALRTRGRGPSREVSDEQAYLNEPAPAADHAAALDGAVDAARLRAAIATLPPGQRQAVELLALHERSLAEAADATGRSKGALKVNLHRAVAALRRKLIETGDG